MNPRIQELMTKAGIDVERLRMHPGGFPREDLLVLEDFAELIVKECISVPYDMWDKAELNADVAVKIEHRIKEHFGVSE